MSMQADTRFEMKMPSQVKARLRAAAKREGRSLASFLIYHAQAAAASQPLKKQARA